MLVGMPTTLMLGAGASLASALHFHKLRNARQNPPLDSTFFEKIGALGIKIPANLRTWAATEAAVDPFDPASGPPVRMEEFFKELYGDFQDTPALSGLPTRAYSELVDVYGRVLRETTNWLCADNRTGSPVGKLIQQLADATDDLSIITFNHDLVIENEIVKRARQRKRWCLTQGYGTFGAALQVTAPCRAPAATLFPDHGIGCDHTRPISLYKLHGSRTRTRECVARLQPPLSSQVAAHSRFA